MRNVIFNSVSRGGLARNGVRLALWIVIATAPVAYAQESVLRPPVPQPPMNLGQTSFLDGEAGEGGLIEFIADGTRARRLMDADGDRSPGRFHARTATAMIHPAYVSEVPVLGGRMGIEALLPLASVKTRATDGPSIDLTAVGDVMIAPFFQWSGARLMGRPLSIRVAAQMIAPTGAYSSRRGANIGLNAWQISPYVAFTLRASDKLEVSGRAIYAWSSRNHDPATVFNAASIQSGEQVNLNLSASYAVSGALRLGVSGYAFQQISDGRVDRRRQSDSRQRVFAIGPGVRWQNGKFWMLGTAYKQFAAENRPQGYHFVVRMLRAF